MLFTCMGQAGRAGSWWWWMQPCTFIGCGGGVRHSWLRAPCNPSMPACNSAMFNRLERACLSACLPLLIHGRSAAWACTATLRQVSLQGKSIATFRCRHCTACTTTIAAGWSSLGHAGVLCRLLRPFTGATLNRQAEGCNHEICRTYGPWAETVPGSA